MLTKEKLQDAVKCAELSCLDCSMIKPKVWCQAELAKTALELMEENARLKDMLKKCDPNIINLSGVRTVCKFCGKYEHKEDCVYRKAVEG